jgi:23S rRNA (cytidine1920-2'-O)/16S rRNA (cytidine1409-2'-O)-methyltransferase
VLDKAGVELAADAVVEVLQPPRFVSRGGEKLEAFLVAHPVDVAGQAALDVGASTGGFTDCLLQRGAAHVTCVDVGRAQLHARIAGDARVTGFEQLHACDLPAAELPRREYGIVVMDLSFISLRRVLPCVWPRVAAGGVLVALVKPQFEAGREEASRGRGVIRDDAVRDAAIAAVRAFALAELPGCVEEAAMDCPVHGADGNREALVRWRKIVSRAGSVAGNVAAP